MNKRAFLIALAVIASAVYDFYRGYHEDHSIVGGLVWVIGGLIVLAVFCWLYSQGQHSKTTDNSKRPTALSLVSAHFRLVG
jgi:hypothetical protein